MGAVGKSAAAGRLEGHRILYCDGVGGASECALLGWCGGCQQVHINRAVGVLQVSARWWGSSGSWYISSGKAARWVGVVMQDGGRLQVDVWQRMSICKCTGTERWGLLVKELWW